MTDQKRPSVLQRWATRKQQTQQTPLPAASAEDQPMAPAHPTPTPVTSNPPASPPPLTDADMPPLETLNAESDYQQFFSPEVSEELRRLALRKLFHQAQFNHDDGLEMYNDDFTQFEPLGDVVTHDMQRMLDLEKQREAEKLAASEADAAPQQDAEADKPLSIAASDSADTLANCPDSDLSSTQKASAHSHKNDKLCD